MIRRSAPLTILLIAFLCAAIVAILLLRSTVVFAEASIIFDPSKRTTPNDVTTLPVQLTEIGKIFSDTYFRLPQEGGYLGTFTREITVYEKSNAFSAIFEQMTMATGEDGEIFMGTFPPAGMLFKSALPQPTIVDATFLVGIDFMDVEDEVVTFDPPAAFRLPLAEPQHGNDEVTVYYFDSDAGEYAVIDGELSTDGEGYLFPAEKTGIYAAFAAPGTIPDAAESVEGEASEDEDAAESDEGAESNAAELETDDEHEESDIVDTTPTVTTAASISTFRDVSGHWSEPYVSALAQAGLVGNAPIYNPDEPATRAELARLIAEYKYSIDEIDTCIEENIPSPFVPVFFIDIPQQYPYAKYICAIAIDKITTGLKDGTFAPGDTLSRAEALKLLYSAAENVDASDVVPPPFEDVKPGDWFYQAVSRALAEGVADGFTITTSDNPLQIFAERVNRGESSENALLVQKVLQSVGFYAGALDGTISDQVTQAVLQYQLSRGIIQTPLDFSAGNIGPSTIAKLNAENAAENIKVKRLFRPHDTVTRAEVAKFAVLILGIK